MNFSRNLIVSSSGKLYGSEQVLIDFLEFTSINWEVAVPLSSALETVLQKRFGKFRIWSVKKGHPINFIIELLFRLLQNRYSVVYFNEAGYSKYVIWLARLFKSVKFVIHVRLTEDAVPDRWPLSKLPRNLSVITVSEYIRNILPVHSQLIYDPYQIEVTGNLPNLIIPNKFFVIGVIGRITASKGSLMILDVCKELLLSYKEIKIQIFLFGDLSEDIPDSYIKELKKTGVVEFKGFIYDKEKMYSQIDAVLHLSETEPLGRIYLEAINYNKPFIGFKSGGIGEIGSISKLDHLLVVKNEDFIREIANKLAEIYFNYSTAILNIEKSKVIVSKEFNPDNYVRQVEEVINH